MKKFISGILVGTILATAIGSFASGFWDNIDVLRNDISVIVNGSFVDSENFVYNDTTYLPLRAISNALNVPVQYDEDTNTALIGKITTPTTVPTPIPPLNYTLPIVTEDSPLFSKTDDGLEMVLIDGAYYIRKMTIEQKLKEMGFGLRYGFGIDEFWDRDDNYKVLLSNIPTLKDESEYIPIEYYYTTIMPLIYSL